MPHNGLRYTERSKSKLSKLAQLPKREIKPTARVITSDQDSKIIDAKPDQTKNIKKEEHTPENNDVKTDPKG